ncbi:novel acetylcholine receptor chaperone [Neocloeon triangulifer]|uniref:novel acetylcholine receptor chaperone n=1 Tax=Neocloeon triangulifer TaxID=2078957 RepID=UPI00286F5177|nr:novel acetylcholine receptor chaperone [Neocloeon triangulifer]
MASIVLKSLSILLGLFFIFVGIMKITPKLSKDLHKDLRKEYVRYSKVFPLAQTLDFKVPSKWYRRVVGSLEVVCGLALTFVPFARVKQGANIILVVLMLMAVYSHYMVNDKFERIAPALVFFFMLVCRLVVDWQLRRKELLKLEAAAATNGEDKQTKQD